MKKRKNVRNRTLAALLIAASMTTLGTPAFAAESPVSEEKAYTVTEDEQGTVTIEFNEPLVLTRTESYAGDETEEDGILRVGSVAYEYIPEAYWGTYTSTGGSLTLSIQGRNDITFDGRHNYDGVNNFWHVYCDSSNGNLETVYFMPNRNKTNGLVLHYKAYTIIQNSGNVYKTDGVDINGWYEKDDKTFVIAGIIYHPQK